MTWKLVVCSLSLIFGACNGQGRTLTLTEQEAIRMGFSPVTCGEKSSFPVYILLDSIAEEVACTEVAKALEAAQRTGPLRDRVGPDSVAIGLIEQIYYFSPGASPPNRLPGFAVTFDLINSDSNVVVNWEVDDSLIADVAPEGLSY